MSQFSLSAKGLLPNRVRLFSALTVSVIALGAFIEPFANASYQEAQPAPAEQEMPAAEPPQTETPQAANDDTPAEEGAEVAQADADEEAEEPEEQIDPTLTAEEKAFINDAKALRRLGLTPATVKIMLDNKEPVARRKAVMAMMATREESKRQDIDENTEGADSLDIVLNRPDIPLNPNPNVHRGVPVVRPAILDDQKREPGPFSVHRYLYPDGGIPTFAGAPVAIRKEDLVAGKVEAAFLGVPLGMSSGWRDSKNAPGILRAMYGVGGFDVYGGIDPAVELRLADYGNLAVDNMGLEMSVGHIREMVAETASVGTVPFIVGGDHSVMFPTVAGMSDQFGVDDLTVVHMDAHAGAERDLAHLYSDRQSVARLLEEELLEGENLIQVGLRDPRLTADTLRWLRSEGVKYHTMAEIEADGFAAHTDKILDEAKATGNKVFISFDASVLDPAYGQAAGRPAAGGLTMREAMSMVRRLCAETEVVGFEMLDVSPYLDLSYKTQLNANAVMHACLTGMAMRKKGFDEPGYLSPLTLSHSTD